MAGSVGRLTSEAPYRRAQRSVKLRPMVANSSGPRGRPPHESPPQGADDANGLESEPALVQTLVTRFADQVQRALGTPLDRSETSLAFVDHYLGLARDETREPILSLLAAGAGAYFGEVVRQSFGATWIGRDDPRSLRLLLAPQLLHFAPVDLAFEAILGTAAPPNDPRLPPGPPLDTTFHVPGTPPGATPDAEPEALDDGTWLQEQLVALPPMPEDQFHSLTGRFETLQLMVELLAGRHASLGRAPKVHGIRDYLEILTTDANSGGESSGDG